MCTCGLMLSITTSNKGERVISPICWISLHFWHSSRNLRQPAELRRISLQVILPLPKGLVMTTSSFTLPSAKSHKHQFYKFTCMVWHLDYVTNPASFKPFKIWAQSTLIGRHVHVEVHCGVKRAEEVPVHACHGREQTVEALERVTEQRTDASAVAGEWSQETGKKERWRVEVGMFGHLGDDKKTDRPDDQILFRLTYLYNRVCIPVCVLSTFILSENMPSTPSAISEYFSSRLLNFLLCLCPSCSRVSIFSPLIQMEKGDVLFSTSSSCQQKEKQTLSISYILPGEWR